MRTREWETAAETLGPGSSPSPTAPPRPTQVKLPRTTFLSPTNMKEKFQLGLFYTFSEDHEKLINEHFISL